MDLEDEENDLDLLDEKKHKRLDKENISGNIIQDVNHAVVSHHALVQDEDNYVGVVSNDNIVSTQLITGPDWTP